MEEHTLIVCRNKVHEDMIRRCFAIEGARYICHGEPLMGRRFKKIIIFPNTNLSIVELERFSDWVGTSVLTKLEPGGEYFLV